MNKLIIMLLTITAFMSPAIGADQTGDKCQQIGAISKSDKGYVLSCVDNKWKKIGTTQIAINVNILEGDKLLHSGTVFGLDGQTIPVSISKEYSRQYTASATKTTKKSGETAVELTSGTVKEGFSLGLTPALAKNGKIEVDLLAKKSNLTQLQTIRQGDLVIQAPQVSTLEMQQKFMLTNGETIAIPYGSMIPLPSAADSGADSGVPSAKYTILLTAATVEH